MENNKQSKILYRYLIIIVVALVMCCLVIGNTLKIIFVEREGWNKKSEATIRKNVTIPAQRGNILSANDEILASTIKEYRLFFDFRQILNNKNERLQNISIH